MSIFVGNLPFRAEQEDVIELFAAHGEVTNCALPLERDTGRKRGFAFVEMVDEAAEAAAIDALQGVELMGRPLRINKAEPVAVHRVVAAVAMAVAAVVVTAVVVAAMAAAVVMAAVAVVTVAPEPVVGRIAATAVVPVVAVTAVVAAMEVAEISPAPLWRRRWLQRWRRWPQPSSSWRCFPVGWRWFLLWRRRR